jgi:hypothetical protein
VRRHITVDEICTLTLGQAHKATAVFFGTLAALAAFFFFRMSWSRGPDFDLTGFFWLIANIGRLTLLGLFVICTATAVSYWIRALRAGG